MILISSSYKRWWQRYLNIDRTNFMIFKNKHSDKPGLNFKIEIDDKTIEKVDMEIMEIPHLPHMQNSF